MRNFINISKIENIEFSEKFSFLLKYNDDCTLNDCSEVAITIFDHWLYESDSFSIINNATEKTKIEWDEKIQNFLTNLVELEKPLKYKYIGRNTKKNLQFSRYIGHLSINDYITKLYHEVYRTNVVFVRLGVVLWFEDNWTIYIKYKTHNECSELFELAAKHGLYILPAYSAEHLNNYSALSVFLNEKGLNLSLIHI